MIVFPPFKYKPMNNFFKPQPPFLGGVSNSHIIQRGLPCENTTLVFHLSKYISQSTIVFKLLFPTCLKLPMFLTDAGVLWIGLSLFPQSQNCNNRGVANRVWSPIPGEGSRQRTARKPASGPKLRPASLLQANHNTCPLVLVLAQLKKNHRGLGLQLRQVTSCWRPHVPRNRKKIFITEQNWKQTSKLFPPLMLASLDAVH